MNKIIFQDTQPIIAQCTPQGKGALALIRISGKNAITLVDCFAHLKNGKNLENLPSHSIHYGSIVDGQNNRVDNVLFFLMRAPSTFTGEDTVEISCHNNPFIIDSIITTAIFHGARIAGPGEFTKQAVLNEKIDLLQAEAIDELIHANTQMALKQALAQVDGTFSAWINRIEQELVQSLALSEASFEFLDEESMEFGTVIAQNIQALLSTINQLKKTFNAQQAIKKGITIALIGSVNAGKSSLFNDLVGSNRAIVSDIAGTTRDAIELSLYKNGNYWTLVDTAGLRNTSDSIEQEGIKRSFEQAKLADIILLVFDSSRNYTDHENNIHEKLLEEYGKKIIVIHNKIDIKKTDYTKSSIHCEYSQTQKDLLMGIENCLEKKISELFSAIEAPFLLNQRQMNLLLSLEQKLTVILDLLTEQTIAYELVSIHINSALQDFAELTGKSIQSAVMDTVFRNFCVGK